MSAETKAFAEATGLVTLFIISLIAALLLSGCATQAVATKFLVITPPKTQMAPALNAKQSAQLMNLSLPKHPVQRTLTVVCNPVAGASSYGWAWGTNSTSTAATNWTASPQITVGNLPPAGRVWLWCCVSVGTNVSPWSAPTTFSKFVSAWQMCATGACRIAGNIAGPWTLLTNYTETVIPGSTTGSRFLSGMVATSVTQVPMP